MSFGELSMCSSFNVTPIVHGPLIEMLYCKNEILTLNEKKYIYKTVIECGKSDKMLIALKK